MSTTALICFIDDITDEGLEYIENTEFLNVSALNKPCVYRHNDGEPYTVLNELKDFLDDDALRKHDAQALTAWYTHYTIDKLNKEYYKDDKRQIYVVNGLEYDLRFIEYVYLIFKGSCVVIYDGVHLIGTFYTETDDVEAFY